jgi:hypothetical protein
MSACGRGVSRRESLALFLHRGLDRWLSPLGVWVYRRTKVKSQDVV